MDSPDMPDVDSRPVEAAPEIDAPALTGPRFERAVTSAPAEPLVSAIDVASLNLFYGDFLAVHDVNVKIARNHVTALIGSSGCGKSTFLRSLNRMHELVAGAT